MHLSRFKKLSFRLAVLAFVFATLLILLLVFGYYKAGKQISYLPALKAGLFKTGSDTKSTIELKGVGYILDASKSGDIKVKTPDGSLILSGLKFYSEYRGTKPKIGLDSVTVQLRNDSTLSISGKGAFGTKVGLTLTVPSHRSRLDVSVRTRYSRDVKIDRESLIAGFGVPVSKIYLKNRKEVSGNFSSQYWLQRQGVRFGKGERSALVYNCQEVSSLQLDVNRRHLFINLDYYLDHPFIHYPYQKDAGGRWKDLSRSEYHGDNVTKRTFAIHFDVPEEIPRLKLTPYGYLAAYVFTEHADGGTLKSNRAAYFGAEDISDINKAVGGFAAHRIPVTKSVFFFNPDSANYVSVRDDPQFPAFRNFLDHLNATGLYDLCLHTPENLNSTRERMEESVSYMHGRYNTSTWIDHGFYNGKINRECFVADGLDPTKVLYGADLWRKYNTRYFWSPAVEEMHTYSLKDNLMHLKFYDVAVKLWSRYLSPKELTEMSFRYALINLIKRLGEKNELDCFLPGKGSSYPTPIAWQNKTISGDFYSWVTDDFYKDFKDMDQKSLDHEKKLLERMISEWGIYINHGYYVRYGSGHGVINKKDGKMVINPYFDRMLAIMSDMRDRGDLELVTVRGLLDYWVLLRKVSFDYLPDGKIIVCNNNDKPVNGLSLAVDGSGILVDGRVPEMKKAGEDTVFWFDIPAGDRAEISIAAP